MRWVSELLDQERRYWDVEVLRSNFNQADVEAIAKINLPQRLSEDFLAWHFEKSGMSTVKSAYNLALRLSNMEEAHASSTKPEGERKLWTRVWSGAVPPKVNLFAWKLARDILPTRHAKYLRNLEKDARCKLCDREVENSFHVTVSCPQAQGLGLAMRQHCNLPNEQQFRYTGPDWFLLLLDKCSVEQRDLVKLVI